MWQTSSNQFRTGSDQIVFLPEQVWIKIYETDSTGSRLDKFSGTKTVVPQLPREEEARKDGIRRTLLGNKRSPRCVTRRLSVPYKKYRG
jgi:hypothetical protein